MNYLTKDETKLLAEKMPAYFLAIQKAKADKQPLLLALASFEDNPMLLFLAMMYASDEGVAVTLVPRDKVTIKKNGRKGKN